MRARPPGRSIVSMTIPVAARGRCLIDGREVYLTLKEQQLLEALLLQPPDRWLHVRWLTEVLWPDPDRQPETAWKGITVLVRRLRDKGVPIHCLASWGYQVPAENRPCAMGRGRAHHPGRCAAGRPRAAGSPGPFTARGIAA